MVKGRFVTLVGVMIVALSVAPGCVSKKLFQRNNEDTDGRISSVEGAIEDNAKRIKSLERETDEKVRVAQGKADEAIQLGNRALGEAQAASKAAAGKLLWEVTLTEDKLKFDFGQTALTSGAITALEGLVSRVKAAGKQLYIEVEGHTDNVGNDRFNVDLGNNRAMAVRNYLNQSHGIPLHAMSTISYGESRPVADNSTRDGRAQNRRVVVRVLE